MNIGVPRFSETIGGKNLLGKTSCTARVKLPWGKVVPSCSKNATFIGAGGFAFVREAQLRPFQKDSAVGRSNMQLPCFTSG